MRDRESLNRMLEVAHDSRERHRLSAILTTLTHRFGHTTAQRLWSEAHRQLAAGERWDLDTALGILIHQEREELRRAEFIDWTRVGEDT